MRMEVRKMRKKIIRSICLIAIILILMIPNIQANIIKPSNLEKNKQTNWTYIHGIGNFNISQEDIFFIRNNYYWF
jgi:hypothetical protein